MNTPVSSMPVVPAPKVIQKDGQAVTTSLDVAEYFGKQHAHILRNIESLQVPEKFYLSNFGEMEIRRPSPLGIGVIISRAYHMTRDGFILLAMGFTGKKAMQFKVAYIEAFNAMETELAKPATAFRDSPLITTAMAGELATKIAERFPNGRDRPYAWSQFNKHFRIARYRELPQHRFAEACAYIPDMPGPEDAKVKALPAPEPEKPKALPAPEYVEFRVKKRNFNEGKARLDELQIWADKHLEGHARHEMLELIKDVRECLVHGYTEMDEARIQMGLAMAYLARWRHGTIDKM